MAAARRLQMSNLKFLIMKKKETYANFVCDFVKTDEFKSLDCDCFDYFKGNSETEFLDTDRIFTKTDFGANEGVYIDFYTMRCIDGKDKMIRCATAKDLRDNEESYIKNHIRAAKICLLMNKMIASRYWERVDTESQK